MKAREIREAYLKYFEQRGHAIRPSASLAPVNDPTLLFTSAGMNQFKDYFLGKGEIPFSRVTTSQRCLRTGDIDRVGITPAHHTFFEMLGNFSFNDYFRREAIGWAWDFLLKVLGIDSARLSVTVYRDDQAAYDIWHKEIGLPVEKIIKLGEADNFWPANAPSEGPNGPCGPCTEIFYDLGADVGCGRSDCGPACSCKRFIEVWNLVFTEFDRREGGTLLALGRSNVDTGMGLERITAVMQGKRSNFETDLFMPIINKICEVLNVRYEFSGKNGFKIRRIADHVRAVSACIADSITPSNEGRGYVVRRLLRRAAIDGRGIGAREPFLFLLVDTVVETLGDFFREFQERRDAIKRAIRHEEDSFDATLNQGLRLIEEDIQRLKKEGKTVLGGQDAFRLYDTRGFPLELTESILAEQGMEVDKEGFNRAMSEQRERARSASMFGGEVFAGGSIEGLGRAAKITVFEGYHALESQGTIVAVIRGESLAEEALEGESVALVLDRSPFYARSGGQVGDTGRIFSNDFEFRVEDTTSVDGYVMHRGRVLKGRPRVGLLADAAVDAERRNQVAANHTATHLLHWALRSVLGSHVAQAGSEVSDQRFRFDFSHIGAISQEQLDRIERMVNEAVMENSPVQVVEMSLDEARKAGAIALFNEKYGDVVRMVSVGDFSKELCGGTHASRASDIGLFKIASEEAVASGIRRITGVTRLRAYEEFKASESQLKEAAQRANAQIGALPEKIDALLAENKKLRKETEKNRAKEALSAAGELLDRAEKAGSLKVLTAVMNEVGREELQKVVESLTKREESLVVVLGGVLDGKAVIIAGCGALAVKGGMNAGNIVRAAAQEVGGSGGGRPQFAQAGGPEGANLQKALEKARELIKASQKAP